MAEGRGRGRAALFSKNVSQSEPTAPRPRGRSALFQSYAPPSTDSQSSIVSGDGDTKTETKSPGTSSYDSGTVVSSALSTENRSDSTKPKSGMGRAALFGLKSSSSGISSDLSSAVQNLSVVNEPTVRPRERITPEKNAPVIKHGISGRKVNVGCNYVRLEMTNADRGVYEYEVSFEPDVDHKIAKLKLVNKHFLAIGGTVKVYDAGWRLWTPTRTEEDVTSGTYELYDGNKFKVTFKFKRVKKFVDCRMILNIIMKRIMGELQLIRFGRNDYNPKMAQKIPEHKLEIWPGCITTIEEYEGGILLNCDASHRVLQSNTVLDMIYDVAEVERARVQQGQNNPVFQDNIRTTLLGLSVITKYNNRIIKIDDIDFEKNPKCTFLKNQQEVSYIDYYKKQYNIDIKDVNQPLLISRVKRKPMGKENEDILNYYVPELCSPTGLTDDQRSNFRLMKEVAKVTQVNPEQRDSALKKFLKGIHENENCKKMLNDWGLKLPYSCIEVAARTLEPETIYFGNRKQVQESSADWGRALSNAPMLSSIDLENWAIIYTSRDSRVACTFYEKMCEIGRKINLKINKPRNIKIENDRPQTYCMEIKRLKDIQIVVTIFPSQRDDRYATVKKLCNVELGVPSQVIISRTLQKDGGAIRSVVMKILLQMNCKMGGALWGVSIPYKEEGVMFCGIDAYHEKAHRSKSILALVASINLTCTRWTQATAVHNLGQEISDKITELFITCLQEWYKINGSYPKRIIMFRDGVGDGQLMTVRDFEIPQFKRVFKQMHHDYSPFLTYIIVQKRINTRYYIKKDRGGFDNPPPGTVLDNTITRRDWYDFFLVSQNVRQGTVAPTHYVVIEDSSDMNVDLVQKITYKMTHLYYNWNGTVRVPAPCQYAHKLAYLIGQHVHAPAAESLRNTLFYL